MLLNIIISDMRNDIVITSCLFVVNQIEIPRRER